MTYKIGYYDPEFQAPMTEVFFVGLYQDYSWNEGRLFRHDETGRYVFITDAGCSCNSFLSYIETKLEYDDLMRTLDWTPLDQQVSAVTAYIESDVEQYEGDRNGPDWVVAKKAELQIFLRHERQVERARLAT